MDWRRSTRWASTRPSRRSSRASNRPGAWSTLRPPGSPGPSTLEHRSVSRATSTPRRSSSNVASSPAPRRTDGSRPHECAIDFPSGPTWPNWDGSAWPRARRWLASPPTLVSNRPCSARDAGMLLDDAHVAPVRRVRPEPAHLGSARRSGGRRRPQRTRAGTLRERQADPRARRAAGTSPDSCRNSPASSSPRSSPGTARPSGASTGPRLAVGLGDAATQADLVRTEAQRRADAMLAMARASVSRDPAVARPPTSAITVDILLDHDTMVAHASGTTPDARRFRNVVCRTQSGRRLHPDDAVTRGVDRPHSPSRLRRLRHGDRTGSAVPPVPRLEPRGGHAAAHHLRLDRLRPPGRVV